jgi:hypothetical protein
MNIYHLTEKDFDNLKKHTGHTLKLCKTQNITDCLSEYLTVRCIDCAEMIISFKADDNFYTKSEGI